LNTKFSDRHPTVISKPVRSKERFLVFGAPAIEKAEIQEVVESMKSGWLGSGPKVAQFEEEFRAYKGAKHAVALNSCTAALHLSLLTSGLKPGDEVITSSMTFCATVNAIIHAGATPVLADTDRRTMNIDPAQVESRITKRTRAILPVHFAGRPCDMDQLGDIASRYKLKIIEDCAHAVETEYRGRKAGLFGDFGCHSFYVTKNVVTGEGGIVLIRNEEDANRLKVLALHGLSHDAWKRFQDEGYLHYKVELAGFKYNMMDLQAAIGLHQLRRVEANWKRRREIWHCYNKELANLPLGLPPDPEPETRHAYHLYTVFVDKARTGMSRDAFLQAMTAQNIGVAVHYLSIPEHPFYRRTFGWKINNYPQAKRIGQQTVSLPLSAGLTNQDVADVIEAVTRVLRA
jgi:dTDP-4-amino-4,6-dideoxygalactose transaminase